MADEAGSHDRFMKSIAEAVPDAPGYLDPAHRADTDVRLRGHIVAELGALREKLGELKASAEEEGEEDMLDDLDRIDARMERTIGALGDDGHARGAFFTGPVGESTIDAVCQYDLALLEDVALLVHDTLGLKYETIGNLTLREIEGTLAAIELKVANRADVLSEAAGRK